MRAQITKDLLHCLHDGIRAPSIYCPLQWQLLALDCDRLRQQTHRSALQKMTLSRTSLMLYILNVDENQRVLVK